MRLVGLAVGVSFSGRAYEHVEGIVLLGHRRLLCCPWPPCDINQGYRTRARKTLCKQWVRGPAGFVRRADPCLAGPYHYYAWQAEAVRGGACGGLLYPQGLCGQFCLRFRLRRTRSLTNVEALHFYYKVGVVAACGALGSRLVPPKLWAPIPAECLQVVRWLSSDGRFWNVEVRVVAEVA